MLLTPTSPPPKVRRSRGRSPPKVWVLPIDISRSNGITESIELLLLRESQFSHHTQDNGDVLYEGEYSTFSIDSYFGAREYRHKGGFTLQKYADKVYTVLASHCLDAIAYEVSGYNRRNGIPHSSEEKLECVLNNSFASKVYEPVQISDPRFIEEAILPNPFKRNSSGAVKDAEDSEDTFLTVNKNHPLLVELATEYAHAQFHPIVKSEVPMQLKGRVLPNTFYHFGYVERESDR